MSTSIPDPIHLSPVELTSLEKNSLLEMVNSDGWKVLTEKVWHQQRQWAIGNVLNPANKPDFYRGVYDGLVKAQWAATQHTVPPPDEEMVKSFEDKLLAGIHK